MSGFLKFAFEVLSQVVYNLVACLCEALYHRLGRVFYDFPYVF